MTAKATIAAVKLNGGATSAGEKLEVAFNPTSLKVSLSNKLQGDDAKADKKDKQGPQKTQATGPSTSKLDVELVFDTTETGDDVRYGRSGTDTVKKLATAGEGEHPAMPLVEFRWGTFSFVGVIESFNETLDFWAAEGIPLRSTVQIAMQEVGRIDRIAGHATLAKAKRPAVVQAPDAGRGTTDVAAAGGNPGAGRAVAAANGIEDMRMAGGGAVAVAAKVDFQAAATFSLAAGASASASAGGGLGASAGAGASAGFGIGASASAGASVGVGASAGVGAGASAGIGISAGVGASAGIGLSAGAGASAGIGIGASASAGAGFGAGATASASAGLFGGGATAGVSASAGAFTGLGSSKTVSVGLPFDPSTLLPRTSPPIGANPQFDVTGKVVSSSNGLGASVTGTASAGITFL